MMSPIAKRQRKSISIVFLVRPGPWPALLIAHLVSVVRKYVEGCKNSSQLLDLLSAPGSDAVEPTAATQARQALYPEVSSFVAAADNSNQTHIQYLPMATLLAGVKSGQLHQGHFNANQYNYLEVCYQCQHRIGYLTRI